MSRAADVVMRFLVLLAAVAGAVFGTALPASPGLGVAVLSAALAALLVLAMRQVYVAHGGQLVSVVAADGPAVLLSGRVTDPTHHPLRPRAPGPA